MKKIKTILLCVIMAMCAVGVVGCGNDDSNGSSQQTTGSASNYRSKRNKWTHKRSDTVIRKRNH